MRGRRIASSAERRSAIALGAAVLGLHVVGFVTLLVFLAPRHLTLGRQGVLGLGIGMTAYTLGLRHALDADHISAIDNATRKLIADGKRPLSTGFFFSLGHSTLVFGLALLFAAGTRAISGQFTHHGSTLHGVTSLVGTSVSGSFLYLIAIINLITLVGIVKAFRRMRRGDYDQAELERQLDSRGLMNRVLGRVTRAIDQPWKMYPVGILFGLGFDTASEVALLFLAAGGATNGLPFYAILCLPVLFAAGMSLLDTLDGLFMNFAYGWAFAKPLRRVYYNITITGLSVAVALVVGTIELVSILANRLTLKGGFWDAVSNLNLNTAGFVIVGLFAATWVIALAVWRVARIEDDRARAASDSGRP
jgi:high-affinity nickel-transport protein